MKKLFATIFFVVLFFNLCFSIKALPDSLLSRLENAENDKKVEALLAIADLLVDSASFHDQANEYLDEALGLSIENKDTISEIKVLICLGSNEFTVGNYENATDYFYQALQLAERISNSDLMAKANHNLGMLYDDLEEYDLAIDFYNKSLRFDESNRDTLGIIKSYINLSISFQNKENIEQALKYCNDAFELAVIKDDSVSLVAIINNLGTIAYDKKEYDKCIGYYNQALKLYIGLNDKDGIATSYNNLGLVYLDLKDYPKAKKYFFEALKLAESLNMYSFSGDICSNLTFYFEGIGDFKNALLYYDKYNDVYDSLMGEKTNKQIRQLQVKYETAKKQNQILVLEKKNSSQLLVIKNAKAVQVYLIIISTIVIGLLFFMIYLLRNKRNLIVELKGKTDELKVLNASKDKFFSIIAHDLRNPFHALFSYTKLLQNGLDDFSKDEVTEILSDLHDATDQGYNLLQNLLIWTRSQSNRIHIFRSDFKMRQVLEEVLNLAKPSALKKDQQIVLDIQDDCSVNADKDMVSTILRNLVFNAIKFSDAGKIIRIELSLKMPDVHVKVIDKGVGMSEDQIKKLFVIDEHGSTVGTSGELGSGLGLILCHEFASKNKGRIAIESSQGIGSVFTLIMPCLNFSAKNE